MKEGDLFRRLNLDRTYETLKFLDGAEMFAIS